MHRSGVEGAGDVGTAVQAHRLVEHLRQAGRTVLMSAVPRLSVAPVTAVAVAGRHRVLRRGQ